MQVQALSAGATGLRTRSPVPHVDSSIDSIASFAFSPKMPEQRIQLPKGGRMRHGYGLSTGQNHGTRCQSMAPAWGITQLFLSRFCEALHREGQSL